MLRATTVKQLSIMRADTTKKQLIMLTPPEDTRFTLDTTQTKPPWLIWKSTASSRSKNSFGGRLSWRPLLFRDGRRLARLDVRSADGGRLSGKRSPPEAASFIRRLRNSQTLARHRQETCACRKSNPNIFVVQSAEDWAAKNTPCPLHGAR